MIIAPFRQFRAYAGISQLLLQFLILLTGNYNFFNLLTMVLSLVCFDDQYLKYIACYDRLFLVEVDEDSLTAADSLLDKDHASNDEEEIRWSWSQIDNFGLMLWLRRCFHYLEHCKYSESSCTFTAVSRSEYELYLHHQDQLFEHFHQDKLHRLHDHMHQHDQKKIT